MVKAPILLMKSKNNSLIYLFVAIVGIILIYTSINPYKLSKSTSLEGYLIEFLMLETVYRENGGTHTVLGSQLGHRAFVNIMIEMMRRKLNKVHFDNFSNCMTQDIEYDGFKLEQFNTLLLHCLVQQKDTSEPHYKFFNSIETVLKYSLWMGSTIIAITTVLYASFLFGFFRKFNKVKIPKYYFTENYFPSFGKYKATNEDVKEDLKEKVEVENTEFQSEVNINNNAFVDVEKKTVSKVPNSKLSNNGLYFSIANNKKQEKNNLIEQDETDETSAFSSLSLPKFFLNSRQKVTEGRPIKFVSKENIEPLTESKRYKNVEIIDSINDKLKTAFLYVSDNDPTKKHVDNNSMEAAAVGPDKAKSGLLKKSESPILIPKGTPPPLQPTNLNINATNVKHNPVQMNFDLTTSKGRNEWKKYLIQFQEARKKQKVTIKDYSPITISTLDKPKIISFDEKNKGINLNNIKLYDPSGKPLRRVMIPGIGWVPHHRAQILVDSYKNDKH